MRTNGPAGPRSRQRAPPKPFEPLPGKEYVTNSLGMRFVKIPKGTFLMGAPAEEKDSSDDERPQHEVEITQDFYLGVYPVLPVFPPLLVAHQGRQPG
jgi:formylglycine-generating enzyme required for sulfatase activity